MQIIKLLLVLALVLVCSYFSYKVGQQHPTPGDCLNNAIDSSKGAFSDLGQYFKDLIDTAQQK